MMRSNTIFVEGVADERFIWQLAEHLFGDISERITLLSNKSWLIGL